MIVGAGVLGGGFVPGPRIVMLHLRTSRPHDPGFQRKLDVLNSSAMEVAQRLGATTELWAAGEASSGGTLAVVDRADAVVVMGGEDVHPQWYGGAAAYVGQGRHDLAADEAQLAGVLRCLDQGKPILGLCRGHQLINVALGGTLIQHLPQVESHRRTGGDGFVEHQVWIRDDGLAEDLDADRPVYCAHHQAIDRLGAGLRVAALSADGVVEAVVGSEFPATGVQWHPEHPAEADAQLGPLLQRVIRQAGGEAKLREQVLSGAANRP